MNTECPYCGEEIKQSAKKCKECGEWIDASETNGEALECPWCAKAEGAREPVDQTCASCGKTYQVYLGPRMKPNLVKPRRGGKTIRSKSSGMVTHMAAEVTADGISLGTLDPIAAVATIDAQVIDYADVLTMTTWARKDWFSLVVTILLGVPTSALLIAGTISSPYAAIVGVPIWLLTAFGFYRSLKIGARFMRVCGIEQTLSFRYDAPVYKQATFHRQALHRAGIKTLGS